MPGRHSPILHSSISCRPSNLRRSPYDVLPFHPIEPYGNICSFKV
jgi:hypothetical protein